MGIILEFGENTTGSVRTSSSPAPTDSPSTRPLTSASELHQNQELGGQPAWAQHLPSKNAQESKGHRENSSEDSGTELLHPDLETTDVLQSARRAALSSAMNRWRNAAVQGGRNREPDPGNHPKLTHDALEENVLGASDSPHSHVGLKNPYPESKQHDDRDISPEGPVYRPPLLSAVDRWRTTVAQRHAHEGHHEVQQAAVRGAPPQTDENRFSNIRPREEKASMQVQGRTLRLAQSSGPHTQLDTMGTADQKPTVQNALSLGNVTSPSRKLKVHLQPPPTGEGHAAIQAWEQRLMARVARAREIYLASKVFNHWADRTARRLEREAVARRHMIRFRCFRGWSYAPTSRTPAVDQLRVATAAQKLKRAVAHNEEQLRLTAAAASQAYHLKKVQQALNGWLCHLSEHTARQRVAARDRMRNLTKWLFRAGDDAALGEAVVTHRIQAKEVNALVRWNAQAGRGATRHTAASQIGQFHLSFAYLRDWWDQSEACRRAQTYRQYRLLDKVTHAFNLWNLQARAQAFMWRNEYLAVTRAFDLWAQRSQIHAQAGDEARWFCEGTVKIRSVDSLRFAQRNYRDLERLEGRARLYIGAIRILDTFDAALARQRIQEKEAVKRHLMMRYQQVSRERKRRNFFSALDRWRLLTAEDLHQASTAKRSTTRQDSQRQTIVIEMWSHQALETRQQHQQARLQHWQSWLNVWADASLVHDHQHLQARALWVGGKQRRYQKVWSISSLQQRGQAHTAAVLGHRRDRDRRNQAFQLWRHRCNKGKNVIFEAASDSPRGFGSSSVFRNKLKTLSTRRSQLGRDEDNLLHRPGLNDTPTRPTGQLFHMGNLSSATPMPPVRELDENKTSSIGDDAVTSPLDPPPAVKISADLLSTTPRGPVPAYLERGFRSQFPHNQQLGKDRLASSQTQLPNRLVASQPSDAGPMLRSLGVDRGAGGRSTPRTLSRPAPARSINADVRGLDQTPLDASLASALGGRSVGAHLQRQYIISRRPVFGSAEDRAASTHATTPQTYSEMGVRFKSSKDLSHTRLTESGLPGHQAQSSNSSSRLKS